MPQGVLASLSCAVHRSRIYRGTSQDAGCVRPEREGAFQERSVIARPGLERDGRPSHQARLAAFVLPQLECYFEATEQVQLYNQELCIGFRAALPCPASSALEGVAYFQQPSKLVKAARSLSTFPRRANTSSSGRHYQAARFHCAAPRLALARGGITRSALCLLAYRGMASGCTPALVGGRWIHVARSQVGVAGLKVR